MQPLWARAFLSAGVHDHEYNVSETGGRGEEEGEAQGEGGKSAFSCDRGARAGQEGALRFASNNKSLRG